MCLNSRDVAKCTFIVSELFLELFESTASAKVHNARSIEFEYCPVGILEKKQLALFSQFGRYTNRDTNVADNLTIAFRTNSIEHLRMPRALLAYQWTSLGASAKMKNTKNIIINASLSFSFQFQFVWMLSAETRLPLYFICIFGYSTSALHSAQFIALKFTREYPISTFGN